MATDWRPPCVDDIGLGTSATSRLTSLLQDSHLLSPPALSASDNPEDCEAADYFG
jgi:hypothetical protein